MLLRSPERTLYSRMHQIAFGGLALPRPAGGAHSALSDLLVVLGKGRRTGIKGVGEAEEGRGQKGRGGEKEGKGLYPLMKFLDPSLFGVS